MADVFARTTLGIGGAFAADRGIISAGKLSGLLMQSLGINYQQNVTRIYELGKLGALMNVYYIGGRSQGSIQAGHVLGPAVAMAAYYTAFSDVCQVSKNSIQIQLGVNGGSGASAGGDCATAMFAYNAKYCVLISIGLAVNANDLVINSQSQLMFSNLEYTGN